MNCPVCNVKLQMAERQGVEANYCPDCRGVWIDRGGLDRIIDRAGAQTCDFRFGEGAREYRELHKQERRHESEGRHRRPFFSKLFD